MKNKSLFAFLVICIFNSFSAFSQPSIELETIASGFAEPVDITNAGDSRLFIVEKEGFIKILKSNGTISTFLNINARVKSTGGEQGLLGLTFHPDYATNGYFYVNYINNSANTTISRFSRSTTNPDKGNPNSELILLTITQPFTNHNGGDINFGPDGYLYIGMGDGGSAGDPGNRAQDTTNLLGKMLRIDVDNGSPYSSPASNPYVGTAGADEIWASGLRNPWRCSFDRLTGDLWIGDVGQGNWEEIDYQSSSSAGGENYGWRCYEGNHTFNTSLCNLNDPFVFPVFEYGHNSEGGFVVTGGFVYRGSQYPSLYGHYIFCDFATGNFWTTVSDGAGGWITEKALVVQDAISTFGEGNDGEIYAGNLSTGEIYHVTTACTSIGLQFSVTNATATTTSDGAIDLSVTGGTGPFNYNWSNGATTEDISGLAPGVYSVTVTGDEECPAQGSATVGANCGPVTNLTITNITSTSATVSWTASGATSYSVISKAPGVIKATTTTSGTSVNLTGLTPNKLYTIKVKNKCPGVAGNFLTITTFNTPPQKLSETMTEVLPVIYPNPGNGLFTIDHTTGWKLIRVMDATGRTILEMDINDKEMLQLELTNVPAGIYMVEMKNEKQLYTQKLMITQ